jgi:hypothetical protein
LVKDVDAPIWIARYECLRAVEHLTSIGEEIKRGVTRPILGWLAGEKSMVNKFKYLSVGQTRKRLVPEGLNNTSQLSNAVRGVK